MLVKKDCVLILNAKLRCADSNDEQNEARREEEGMEKTPWKIKQKKIYIKN